eukprot:scaffold78569_cov77-Cyclotella_meneghiniana.AAC.4
MTSHGIRSIMNSKQEAKDAKREHDHEETNEEKDKAASHEQSRTQSENNQARRNDITIHSITERRGMLEGPEKELNYAMSERESKKTTRRNEKLELEHREVPNHTENHALPRVRLVSKGAEAKYDQKQMLAERKNQEILRSKARHVTSAIKNGRETFSTSTYDQTTDALLVIRQIESRASMNTEERLGWATQRSMPHCKGVLDYISLQYQYSLLLELGESFQSFSQFLDLEKSCLGACTHNLLIT